MAKLRVKNLKLYSTFVWLEKALKTEKINDEDIIFEEFADNYLAYHCIKSYISEDSEIDFIGTVIVAMVSRIFSMKEIKKN